MAKTAKAKAAQPWPYWMLRYVGTGEPQAFEELIWSVGGSPPYGGVSWEEAGAVYEMLESYQGAGRADPEKYSAVESFAGGDHANRLALEIFRIHDSVASSPNDLNETEIARGGSLAEQLQHAGVSLYFLLLQAQICHKRGDIDDAYSLTSEAVQKAVALAAQDPMYSKRLRDACTNWLAFAVATGHFDAIRQVAPAYKAAGVPVDNVLSHIGPAPKFPEDSREISRRGSELLEAGENSHALEWLAEGVKGPRAAGDGKALGGLLGDLAVAFNRSGNPQRAMRVYEEAIPLCREHGEYGYLSAWTSNLGNLYITRGREAEAEQCFKEAQAAALRSGDVRRISAASDNLARMLARKQRFAEAIEGLREARSAAVGNATLTPIFDGNILATVEMWAQTLIQEGRTEEACRVIEETLAEPSPDRDPNLAVDLLILLAVAREKLSDLDGASEAVKRARQAAGPGMDAARLERVEALHNALAQSRVRLTGLNEAPAEAHQKALESAVRNKDVDAEATARVNLAGKLLADNDPKALTVLAETLSFVRALGDQRRELILLLNGVMPTLQLGDAARAQALAARAVELSETSTVDHKVIARLYQAEVYHKGLKHDDLALEQYRAVVEILGQEKTAGRSMAETTLAKLKSWLAGGARLALDVGDMQTAAALVGIFDPSIAGRGREAQERPAPPQISIDELRKAHDPELLLALAGWNRTPAREGEVPAGILAQMRSWAEQLNWTEAAERLARVPAGSGEASAGVSPDASALLELVRHAARTGMNAQEALSVARQLKVADQEMAGMCLFALAERDRLERAVPVRAFWLACRLAADARMAGRLARIAGMFVGDRPAIALADYQFGYQALANGADDPLRAELQNEAALCLQALGRVDEAIELTNSAHAIATQAGAVETAVISRANLGFFLTEKRDWQAAIPVLQDALPRANALGNERLANAIRHNLRMALQAVGREVPADLPFDESDPDALVNEAVRLAEAGDRKAGAALMEKALRLGEGSQALWPNEFAARSTYARLLYDLREYDRAIEQMRSAAAVAERSGNAKQLISSYAWLAQQRNRLGAAAGAYAQTAVRIARARGDTEALSEGLVALAGVRLDGGDVESAIGALREAAGLSQDPTLQVQLGDSLARSGRNDEALAIFQSVLEQREGLEHQTIIAALLGLGQVEEAMGRRDASLAHLREAREVSLAQPAISMTVEAHNRLGQALTSANRPFEAVEVLEEGVRIAQASGLPEDNILIAYGNALKMLGYTEPAQQSFRRSRELAVASGNLQQEARAVHALAGIQLDLGNHKAARALYLEAASLGSRAKDQPVEAAALDSAGLTFTHQGKPERAIEYHLRAAKMHEDLGSYRDAATDCINLAQAYAAVREPENTARALDRYRRNLAAAGSEAAADVAAEGIGAQMYAQQGDWPRAQAMFQAAIGQVEAQRATFTSPAEERRWVEREAQIYNIAAAAAVEAKQPKAAIEFLERNRVRFLESVKLRRNARPAGIDDAAWTEYLRAEDAFSQARARERIRLAEGRQSDGSEVEEARLRMRHARAAVEAAEPDKPSRPATACSTWDELTAPIGRAETAAWISTLGGELLLASVTRDSRGRLRATAAIDKTFSSDELQNWVIGDLEKIRQGDQNQLERLYTEHLGLAALQIDQFPSRTIQAIISRVCDQMGSRLWPRLRAILPKGAKRLILIPSAGFNVLPLHAARLADGTYAGERFEIRYAPSLKTLSSPQGKAAADVLRWKLGQATNPTEDDALAFTIPEAEIAARAFEEAVVRRLPGRRATIEAVLDLLKNCETVHFAGHGFYEPREPERSGLLCAMRRKEPSVLTFATMLEQIGAIRARLVVLSGCETGLVQAGDRLNDFLGMSSALLAAGASSVVASLWRVDDMATAMLLSRFFQNWRTGKQSLPAALGSAQQWMRELTAAEAIRQLESWATMPYIDKRAIEARLARLRALPDPTVLTFESPIYWAGFCVNGACKI